MMEYSQIFTAIALLTYLGSFFTFLLITKIRDKKITEKFPSETTLSI